MKNLWKSLHVITKNEYRNVSCLNPKKIKKNKSSFGYLNLNIAS